MVLQTLSFNCHGLNASVNDIQDLCKEYDIEFLQETWLFKDELHLHSMHPEFDGAVNSSTDCERMTLWWCGCSMEKIFHKKCQNY